MYVHKCSFNFYVGSSDNVILIYSSPCLNYFRGKYAPLENISCKIKSGCKEHLPWPQGICTKCQPNALTLNRQVRFTSFYQILFSSTKIVICFMFSFIDCLLKKKNCCRLPILFYKLLHKFVERQMLL